jgi:CMP-N,N'-diacetyllegionaminic acid synthase
MGWHSMLTQMDLIVPSSETLHSVLRRMTRNRLGIVFVCDEDGHLVGALSDGDVRRRLLDDGLLTSTIQNVMNTDPVSASSVEEATELLHQMNFAAVPVVNAEGTICDVVIEEGSSVRVLSRPESTALSDTGRLVEAGALAVIPARGSSKRIPRKNLASVGGKSLLAWAIQTAKDAQKVSHVLVSTDDAEIADAARSMGIDVPWMRPAALAGDTTSSLEVLVHVLSWAVQKLTPAPEFAVLLEPTAPFRRPEQVDEVLSILMNSDADCVATVSELPHVFHPDEVLRIEGGLLKPYQSEFTMDSRRLRNNQSSAYVLNGVAYAVRIQSVLSGHGLFGRKTVPLITRWQDFMDIDTPEDLELANLKMKHGFSNS